MSIQDKEKGLLIGLAHKDSKSIELIYNQNFSTILKMVVNNNGTYDDAKDIFQEAVLALYDKAQAGNFELTCRINTYLYAVCKRIWLKKLNQNKNFIPQSEEISNLVVEEDFEKQTEIEQNFRLMEEGLKQLGEPCKALIESFYIKKMDMQAIAETFGYTNAANAKTQKYKCLMRLKKIFFAIDKKK